MNWRAAKEATKSLLIVLLGVAFVLCLILAVMWCLANYPFTVFVALAFLLLAGAWYSFYEQENR